MPLDPMHSTAAAERLRHDQTRSANLPKLSRSRGFRHMGRFVFLLCGSKKIPSRATQSDSAGAALAFRKILEPQEVVSASDLYGTIFGTQGVAAYSSHALLPSA